MDVPYIIRTKSDQKYVEKAYQEGLYISNTLPSKKDDNDDKETKIINEKSDNIKIDKIKEDWVIL